MRLFCDSSRMDVMNYIFKILVYWIHYLGLVLGFHFWSYEVLVHADRDVQNDVCCSGITIQPFLLSRRFNRCSVYCCGISIQNHIFKEKFTEDVYRLEKLVSACCARTCLHMCVYIIACISTLQSFNNPVNMYKHYSLNLQGSSLQGFGSYSYSITALLCLRTKHRTSYFS